MNLSERGPDSLSGNLLSENDWMFTRPLKAPEKLSSLAGIFPIFQCNLHTMKYTDFE